MASTFLYLAPSFFLSIILSLLSYPSSSFFFSFILADRSCVKKAKLQQLVGQNHGIHFEGKIRLAVWSEPGNLICLGHLFTSTAPSNYTILQSRCPLFAATCNDLPSYISATVSLAIQFVGQCCAGHRLDMNCSSNTCQVNNRIGNILNYLQLTKLFICPNSSIFLLGKRQK